MHSRKLGRKIILGLVLASLGTAAIIGILERKNILITNEFGRFGTNESQHSRSFSLLWIQNANLSAQDFKERTAQYAQDHLLSSGWISTQPLSLFVPDLKPWNQQGKWSTFIHQNPDMDILAAPPRGTIVNLIGDGVVNRSLNQEAINLIQKKSPWTLFIILVCLGLLGGLREFMWHIPTLIGASGLGLFWAWVTSTPFDLITSMVPALGLVLIAAMHLHLVITAQLDRTNPVPRKWKPNLLVAGTSGIGFGALAFSSIPAISDFGKLSCLTILSGWLWIHSIAPLFWKYSQPKSISPPKLPTIPRVCALAILILIPIMGGLVLVFQPSETNGLKYFPADHQVRQSIEDFEDKVSGSSLIHFQCGNLDQETKNTIREIPSFRLVLFADELPNVPMVQSWFAESNGFILMDQSDAKTILAAKDAVEKLAKNHSFRAFGPAIAIAQAQSQLLSQLNKSLSLTMLAIGCLLMMVFGRKVPKMLVFAVNFFPLGLMGCFMYLARIPISISTVMVFTIGFSIAVDDTIHLLNGMKPDWKMAWARNGWAITLTTIVVCIGFISMTWASFQPIRHFSVLLLCGMVGAYIGDGILLPSLLQKKRGSNGNWIKSTKP